MIEKTSIGGVYQRWDTERYMDYRRATDAEAFYKDNKIKDHPIVGKQFLYENDGNTKKVTVQSVSKQWWGGYYLAALYVDDNGSHGLTFCDNINCIDDYICSVIANFSKEFKEI